jgi:hypothetical protein
MTKITSADTSQSRRVFSGLARILVISTLVACGSGEGEGSGGDGSTGGNPDTVESDGVAGEVLAADRDAEGGGDGAASEDASGGAPGADASGGGDGIDGAAAALLDRGEPCASHDACASNWCVATTVGVVCVDVCIETCAEDERCVRSDTGSADEIYLCLPWDTTFPGTTDPGGGADTTGGDGSAGPGDDGTSSADGGARDAGGAGDADGPDGGGPLGDRDGDGIPDEDDLIPCLGFELLVYNQGVTSASIDLNGVTVFGADAFPTTLPLRAPVNPAPGVNSLDLGGQLTGSPNDTLSLFIVSDDGRVWFETLFVRGSGPPRTYGAQFVIDVLCD